MRRLFALAALTAFVASAAHAETWTKFADGDKGTTWSYDADGVYVDKASGRVVVAKAISKPGVIEPGGPGKGVGFIDAIDCKAGNSVQLGAFKPSTGLVADDNWRSASPKAADKPLAAAVCPHAEHYPVK